MKWRVIFLIVLSSFTLLLAQVTGKKTTDERLHSLAGEWEMAGFVMDSPVEYRAKGKWVLNHQFLQFTMRDVNNPPQYEANVYIGYDSSKTHYIVHWLDIFGGEYSKTLGFGEVHSDTIQFVLNYPDKPFRDIIIIDEQQNIGQFLIEYEVSDGKWKKFASYRMKKIER